MVFCFVFFFPKWFSDVFDDHNTNDLFVYEIHNKRRALNLKYPDRGNY